MTRRARAPDARALRRAAQYKAEKARKKHNVRTQKFIEERAEQAKRTYDMGLRIPGQERQGEEYVPSFSKQSEKGLYLP